MTKLLTMKDLKSINEDAFDSLVEGFIEEFESRNQIILDEDNSIIISLCDDDGHTSALAFEWIQSSKQWDQIE